MFITAIILFISIYFYSVPENTGPLKDNNYSIPPKIDHHEDLKTSEFNDGSVRPEEGLSIYIGKSSEEIISAYGKPQRKDPSAYGYEWWIYNGFSGTYMQVGIDNDSVVSIYAIGNQLNVSPYKIGQTIEEIYRSTLLETEIVVAMTSGTYRFELSEEDLNIRPLVQMGDIYAQLSLDKYTSELSSVRFFDKKTLISQRPYEMVYRGELIDYNPSEEQWREIERGSERQIFDITNVIRERFGLVRLDWDSEVAHVAYGHSKDMFENDYFAHESPVFGDLTERMNAEYIEYQMAGENIAADYVDGPAAVEGWLNSEGHRKALLEKEYNQIGVGVYQKNYTQNFINSKE